MIDSNILAILSNLDRGGNNSIQNSNLQNLRELIQHQLQQASLPQQDILERKLPETQGLNFPIESLNLINQIFDCFNGNNSNNTIKGYEWHPEEWKYVILDDRPTAAKPDTPLFSRFVQTETKVGLSEDDADWTIEILLVTIFI